MVREVKKRKPGKKLTIFGWSWPFDILSLMRTLQFSRDQFQRQDLFIDIDIGSIDIHMHLWISFLH